MDGGRSQNGGDPRERAQESLPGRVLGVSRLLTCTSCGPQLRKLNEKTLEGTVAGSWCWPLPADPRSLRWPLAKPTHCVVPESLLTPRAARIHQECMGSVTLLGIQGLGWPWFTLGTFVPSDSLSPCCSCHISSGADSQGLVFLSQTQAHCLGC